ncbi:unnamed protein product [Brachionus calyciflorus]|uniref:Uncharacterized protein n=1 Tax=Brachionus calyciflorus TaxID=104777 RepID=A0A813Y072_9BILA|nr:unnamed protein product [Brachionus calyciflorus]
MQKLIKLFLSTTCLMTILIFIIIYLQNSEIIFKGFIKQNNNLSHNIKKYKVNCKALFNYDLKEISKAEEILKQITLTDGNVETSSDSDFIVEKSQCENFKKARGYYRHEDVDIDFPLAVTILAHESAEQLERILRTLYQPQNIYCIHIDKKSDKNLHNSIKSISDCFDNVFIASKTYDIVYMGHSRLKADVQCLKDLLMLDNLINVVKHPNLFGKIVVDWKYAFNYVSSEFPLMTNRKLVQILKMYNGSNEIQILRDAHEYRHINKWIEDFKDYKLIKTSEKNPPIPNSYLLAKGYCSYIINKKFAEYAVFDEKALSLFKWLETTLASDEYYWSTLQFNTQIYSEHGYIRDFNYSKYSLVRYSGWYPNYKCNGKLRHGMCVFGIRDLANLISRNEFLINKLLLNVDPIAYQCMEEWFDEKEKEKSSFNLDIYCDYIKLRSNLATC